MKPLYVLRSSLNAKYLAISGFADSKEARVEFFQPLNSKRARQNPTIGVSEAFTRRAESFQPFSLQDFFKLHIPLTTFPFFSPPEFIKVRGKRRKAHNMVSFPLLLFVFSRFIQHRGKQAKPAKNRKIQK